MKIKQKKICLLIRYKTTETLNKSAIPEYEWSSWTRFDIIIRSRRRLLLPFSKRPIHLYFPKGNTSKKGQLIRLEKAHQYIKNSVFFSRESSTEYRNKVELKIIKIKKQRKRNIRIFLLYIYWVYFRID